ncbi:MAG: HlyD family type I secretion periplasmic adaptor subunit [Hyphomicrobiales bacterium]|nr:HlyD family type I secretion periplasmic adaptor subunit [Hyphomicrobiales bacterium]
MDKYTKNFTSPTLRITSWVLIILFISIVAGSWVAKNEIVARGQGRIVSAERTQSIQPQFDGQIQQFHVQEGDIVEAGDILLTLVPTEIRSEIDQLEAKLARNQRELSHSQSIHRSLLSVDPADAAFIKQNPDINFQNKVKKRVSTYQVQELVFSTLVIIREKVLEMDAEMDQILALQKTQNSRIEQAKIDAEIVNERNQSIAKLLKNGTISKAVYLDRLRETRSSTYETQIAHDKNEELVFRLKLIRQRRSRIIAEALAKYHHAVAESEDTIDEIVADLKAARNRLQNTTLKAPVVGKIENLRVYTTGGHVGAGQEIMSVVPINSKLEIEAFFENRDVGFLEAGQKALIKLETFPAERFGFVSGTVLHVGADARKVDDIPGWVYAVRITLDQNQITFQDRPYSFSSGMTGTIDVITGERRLISYFFEPIVKAIQDGLREH